MYTTRNECPVKGDIQYGMKKDGVDTVFIS